MIAEIVSLEEIDFSDERFRITEDLALDPMVRSLREIGQLNPVILLESRGAAQLIVCGFRRLHALRLLGRQEALARIESSARAPRQIFSLALLDNLSHRRLTALESARALFVLKGCGVEEHELVDVYLPMLGLKPHKNVLRSYLALHGIAPGVRRLIGGQNITVASAERLAAMRMEAQEAFAALLEHVRFSASLQRKVLDALEELGAAEQGGISEVIGRPEITAIVRDPGLSLFQRGERVYEALYRRIYPRLSHAHQSFREKQRMLGLSGNVRITPDPFFETSCLRVEFEVSSSGAFRDSAAALHRAALAPALDTLFEID